MTLDLTITAIAGEEPGTVKREICVHYAHPAIKDFGRNYMASFAGWTVGEHIGWGDTPEDAIRRLIDGTHA